MNKKILVTTLGVGVIATSLFGASKVLAQSDTSSTSLIQKLTDKFHLNKDEVKAVFEQEFTERHTQMEVKFVARLDQLVKDGKITEAQKKLIQDKRKELEANRTTAKDSMKDKTPEERKTLMQAQKQALDDWAKQNGIDIKYLMGGFGMKGGHFVRK